MARREENGDTRRGLSNPRIFVSRRHVGNVARALDSISSGAKWKMAEGERRSIFSDRARNGRTDKSNPLLSSAGKIQVSEKSSLSQSFEAPKCYGTTRNPMQPQCDVKLIGHVLHPSDTLQGLAIKYGVTVEQLRRTNKIWANDNIHLLKILKVPVKKESPHYLNRLDVSDEESNTDYSGISEDRTYSNSTTKDTAEQSFVLDGSEEKINLTGSSSEWNQTPQTHLSFLEQLDARIKNSKQESEKLRTISGPKVIADVEKLTRICEAEDFNLFRPLETEAYRKQRGQILASKRLKKKDKSNLQDSDEQFYEL